MLASGKSPSEREATDEANAFNEVRFFMNGTDQGVAFSGIPPGGCVVVRLCGCVVDAV